MNKLKNKDDIYEHLLWDGIINGDRNCLGNLFDMYIDELLTYGFRISGDKSLTKDAIQEVFFDIWIYRQNLAKQVQIKYYLYRCLRRAITKQYIPQQSESINISNIENMIDADLSPEMQHIEDETLLIKNQQIAYALNALSNREREIISLKYYSDLKIKDISSLLGIQEQTVANTLQNALSKLRKSIIYIFTTLFLI